MTAAERLARFGPTVGDRVRLADTNLWIEVEADRHAQGDEPAWGYGRNFRARMAQGTASSSELDAVVLGALVVDPVLGVVKADIGIKDGRIVGVGRSGNGAISDGIELPIGPHTRPITAYGLIATPGAIDTHVHTISPMLVPAALSGGVTTFVTAGFEEPPWALERMLLALADWPVNVGLQACARDEENGSLDALLEAGACGFKIHEDYGAYPELIDHTLRYADAHDVSVALHTDGLHESAELEDTVAAIAGRTVHAYHVEGSGGGHVPDLLGLVRESNVLCSSTTPTVPFGLHAADESVPMTILNHGASFASPEDLALIAERTHPATMAAEGPLHELGAIAIVNSDSQGMGRIGETVRRTIQLAHVMKAWRATEAGSDHPGLPIDDDRPADNARVLRYLAKVTTEPAIVHGIGEHVGSFQAGRLADIVLWQPGFFGVKPELVLKGGAYAWGPIGEGNATVEYSEPTRYRADWGGSGGVARSVSVTFVSGSFDGTGPVARRLGPDRRFVPVAGTRGIDRGDLRLNRAVAAIEIDPLDGRVTLAGRPLAVEPATDLPLNRRYFLR